MNENIYAKLATINLLKGWNCRNCARCTVRGKTKKIDNTCWDWRPRYLDGFFKNDDEAELFFSRELEYPEIYKI